ncbi:stress responsive protein [Paenibacillus darwinianus]|uniref:Stress responsive protein n=1 Tax=Paenibacillus darwinianus TaxID=1380763 RepID=A0A9W5S329_9BACL|nr:Dabb family protein [Paenibacillus darwinianus]EXX89440.1 stress responsive protein [Paenibacillus darwinianus]EXX90786.1 stress responsive protein [Paenibacillus darwinianus]EXX90840.1 stress responsive protein [Paenibacillus darwinianus]
MITHIVLFKLKDGSPESIARTAGVLKAMEGKIEELKHLEVGTDILHSERSYDIALITKFESMQALEAYQVHPEHKKVIEHMQEARETSVSVDFES